LGKKGGRWYRRGCRVTIRRRKNRIMTNSGAATAKAKPAISKVALKRSLGTILVTLKLFDRKDLVAVGKEILDDIGWEKPDDFARKRHVELRTFLANCARKLSVSEPAKLYVMEHLLDKYIRAHLRGTTRRDRTVPG
jgi:hypothetical protein